MPTSVFRFLAAMETHMTDQHLNADADWQHIYDWLALEGYPNVKSFILAFHHYVQSGLLYRRRV